MDPPSKRKKDPIYDHWIEQIVFDEDGRIDTRGRYKCKYGCDVSYVPGVDRMKKHTRQVHGLYFESSDVSNEFTLVFIFILLLNLIFNLVV